MIGIQGSRVFLGTLVPLGLRGIRAVLGNEDGLDSKEPVSGNLSAPQNPSLR